MNINILTDNRLFPIATKVANGERLSDDDALTLFASHDLAGVGYLADFANRRVNGSRVFYNINRHINPTNICALSCKFCAFSRKPGEAGAYAYEISEMVTRATEAVAQGATEIHMVGGLHPRWPFKHYLEMIAAIRSAHPTVHIKAFTVVELDWMARKERRPIEQILTELREAGLSSMPGGGAEIFHPEIRDVICDTKVPADQWIATHRLAHKMGLRSNCTMLYGHIERFDHRVDHMRRLRELQDETRGFNVFIPLAFQPFENEMGVDRYTFGFDDLKTIAVARLYLDNFPNIKAYWVMLGQDLAQLALDFGANDLDGTVTEEKISRMAGGRSGMAMSRTDLEGLIRRCGRVPVERDTLYRPIRATEPGSPSERSSASRDGHGNIFELIHQIAKAPDGIEKRENLKRKNTETKPTQLTGRGLKISTVLDNGFNTSTSKVHASNLQSDGSLRFDNHPLTISFDLSENGDCGDASLAELAAMANSARLKHPKATLRLVSLSGIVALANREAISLREVAAKLRDCGFYEISSDAGDGKTPTTDTLKIHRQCHLGGLATRGQIALTTQSDGVNLCAPDWQLFFESIQSYKNFFLENDLTEPCEPQLLSIAIVGPTATDAQRVTSSEYVRAVAMARRDLPQDLPVTTPLTGIPTMAPGSSIGVDGAQHPAEKTAAVLPLFGSAGLDVTPLETISYLRILEDISAWSDFAISKELPGIRAIAEGLRHALPAPTQKIH